LNTPSPSTGIAQPSTSGTALLCDVAAAGESAMLAVRKLQRVKGRLLLLLHPTRRRLAQGAGAAGEEVRDRDMMKMVVRRLRGSRWVL
jgi:hypothetical protein